MVEECFFSFAGKESLDYGIFIANVGDKPDTLTSGVDTEVVSTHLSVMSSHIVYGVKENEKLTFDITLVFPRNFSFETMCDIKDWLFRHSAPQKLVFHHPDLEDYYFMCFIRHGDDWHDGNNYRAMKVTVECISPYAYKTDVLFTVSNSSPYEIFIQSSELHGVKPIVEINLISSPIEITLANSVTDTEIKIINSAQHTLTSGDRIVINNRKKTILINNVLSIDNLSFDNGCGFLTLSDGINLLEGTDGVNMQITYTPTRRIGGV